jgi:adenylyl-sulfate kinase
MSELTSVSQFGDVCTSGAVWQTSLVTRDERWSCAGLFGATVWLTGLSGSGKSAIADSILAKLVATGVPAYVLDADNMRHGLNSDLGFSPDDRAENTRRIGEVARVLADAGVTCLVPIISPYRVDRQRVRRRHQEAGLTFLEVFVDTPLEECRRRDPKGLYRRAFAGELPDFTGVSAPYEAPESPDLHVLTDGVSVEAIADQVIALLDRRTSR